MLSKRIATLVALTLLLSVWLCSKHAAAQAVPPPPATPQRIQAELKAIESAAARNATDDELGSLWGLLASDYRDEMDLSRAEEAYGHSLTLLRRSATAQRSYAAVLDSMASLYLLKGQPAESENCRRKALAIFDALGDRQNSLALHGSLAATLLKEDKFKEAEKEASQAIDVTAGQTQYASDLVFDLIVRAFARCLQHRCNDGLSDAKQAVAIAQASLRPKSIAAASSWSALGYMEWKSSGDVAGCDAKMRRALQILSENNDDVPDPTLLDTRIWALREYQQFLSGTHRKDEARQAENEIVRLTQAQTPVCRNCTVNAEALTNAFH